MAPCPFTPLLNHSILIAGVSCPVCTALGGSGVSSSSTSVSLTPASTIGTAVAPAQYTPAVTGSLATLRDNGRANIGRNKATTAAAAARANSTAAHSPDLYKFNVRVAHAIPVPGSAQLNY